MKRADIAENFFEQNYPESPLPKLWQIIYQEAIRGNHILFEQNDVERFSTATLSEQECPKSFETSIEEIICSILYSNNLTQMKAIICSCPFAVRRTIFGVYNWAIKHAGSELKQYLN